MAGQPGSRRGELARLRVELRGQGWTYAQIAGRIGREQRVNARVAFRLAHGLTQAQVAQRWNAQWPEQEAPRTTKQISYWEVWPACSGRRPSLDTLNKLAFLYQCSAGELLDGQDHSHLDPAVSPQLTPSERAAEVSSATVAAVHLPVVASGAGQQPGLLPDPVGVVADAELVVVSEQFATQLVARLGGLTVVADDTLGLSARQRDVACQQLVDLFGKWAHTMNRRVVIQMLGWAATAAAAGPLFHGLTPDDQERLAAAIRAPSRVDAAVIDHLERGLEHCVRQYEALGPQGVLDTVLTQRQLASGMLAQCPPALRLRLLSVYAHQSGVAGWLHYDLTDFDGAAYYYEQARASAHEAQNPVLGAHVLTQMSQLAISRHQPWVGIDHAVAAQSWAERTDDLLLRAWSAATVARAYARDGQEAACLAGLDTARAGMAAAAGRPSLLAGVFDEGMHSSIRGECLLQLGRPGDAVQAAEASLAVLDRSYVRNVAFTTVDLGSARLACGDLNDAVVTLEQAVDLAVQHRSARLADTITAVRARMQPWQDSAAVVQLDERLRAHPLV